MHTHEHKLLDEQIHVTPTALSTPHKIAPCDADLSAAHKEWDLSEIIRCTADQ